MILKILVISHMYPSPANEVYGIFVHEQVKALIANGLQVRVVSPVPWTPFPINHLTDKWRAYSKIPDRAVINEVMVYYPQYLTFPRAWFFSTSGYRMYNAIRRCVEQIYRECPFDLIHAHTALPDGCAGVYLADQYRKPLIVTVHGQDFQHTIHRNKNSKKAVAFTLSNAARIIVVSKKLHDLAAKHFSNIGETIIIPNGVGKLPDVRTREQWSEEKKLSVIILSVSNLVETKGIDLNIYALNKLKKKYPDLEYLVVGSGPEEKKLRALVESLDMSDWVTFLGRKTHDDVFKYMSMCTLFCLPSWNEGFGVVYIEAMAMGKPVIGCRGEGIEDFVDHGRNGFLVEPRDVNSLVQALDYLLSHPEEARDMGERGRQVVQKNYTWDKNVEKTIEVYQDALNTNR